MAELEKVIKAVDNCIHLGCGEKCPYYDNGCGKNYLLSDVLKVLKEQPQIVRCKDCHYYESDRICAECLRHNGFSPEPNFFCADGEYYQNKT